MKARYFAAALTVAVLTSGAFACKAIAGPNDFFGSTPVGGSPDVTQGAQTAAGGQAAMNVAAGNPSGPPSDSYTMDEKRVQKKYKANVKHAQELIMKGEAMMKSHDDKTSKKGKVLKEIGEKALAELKSNNPFPEIAGKNPNTH